ncbi:MAG TPA: hypothetical protein VIG33_09565 [Pseudobdellovibrionaceae bacterium]
MKMKFTCMAALLGFATTSWAGLPTEAFGRYHVVSYVENGRTIPMKDSGALENASAEVKNRTEVYNFSFNTSDGHTFSVDTLGIYEAAFYGVTADAIEIVKNEVKTKELTTDLDSLIRFGKCERITKTHFAYDSAFSWIKITSYMKLCNGKEYERELLMNK